VNYLYNEVTTNRNVMLSDIYEMCAIHSLPQILEILVLNLQNPHNVSRNKSDFSEKSGYFSSKVYKRDFFYKRSGSFYLGSEFFFR